MVKFIQLCYVGLVITRRNCIPRTKVQSFDNLLFPPASCADKMSISAQLVEHHGFSRLDDLQLVEILVYAQHSPVLY